MTAIKGSAAEIASQPPLPPPVTTHCLMGHGEIGAGDEGEGARASIRRALIFFSGVGGYGLLQQLVRRLKPIQPNKYHGPQDMMDVILLFA